MALRRQFLTGILITALASCNGVMIPVYAGTAESAIKAGPTARIYFAGLGSSAANVLEHRYYAGAGNWNMCLPAICDQRNYDWGSDSLTYALYFRWELTHDRAAVPIMMALAALLLFQVTRTQSYLAKAQHKYTAVRKYFLGGRYPLYTVAAYDNGSRCTQQRGQYFASVNGNMIWACAKLAQLTGSRHYLAQAGSYGRFFDGPPPPGPVTAWLAWRWPASGRHSITVIPRACRKTFFHMIGYYLIR